MKKRNPPSYLMKNIFVFAGVLLLIIGVVAAGFLLDSNQDLRQQAWLGGKDVDVKDVCIGSDCDQDIIEEETPGEFVSETESFEISYNSDVWERRTIPTSVSTKDTDNAFYVLRDDLSFATIYLNAVLLDDELKDKDLEEVGDILEKRIVNYQETTAGEVTYEGKETTVVASVPAIMFSYKETIFDQEAYYYEYLLLGSDHYLEVEVKTTGTGGVGYQTAEFMNGIILKGREIAKGKVQGVTDDSEPTFEESELTEIVKPSVGNVLYLYCKKIVVKPGASNVMKPSYEYCGGGYGSGFIVSGDGLFATNGHVAMSHPEQSLVSGLTSGSKEIIHFLIDLVREMAYSKGLELSLEEGAALTQQLMTQPTTAQGLIKGIYGLLEKNLISIDSIAEKHFVNLGPEPFSLPDDELTPANVESFTSPSKTIFAAEVVGIDYANSYTADVLFNKATPKGSDVAILQLESDGNYEFPALRVGEASSLTEGDSLLILGFPGAVMGDDEGASLLDYANSSTKVTVTKGIVSSIKQDKEGRNLIQTDATIGHGNSGGPAFNSVGEVVGIATYGMKDDIGSFNFLRDVLDLKTLADQEGISDSLTASQSFQQWEMGLDLYWQNRYTKSLDHLAMVQESYPVHPEVAGVIDEANQAIEDGKDIDLLFGIKKEYVYIGGGVVGLLLIGGILVVIMKKRKAPVAVVVPPQGQPAVPQVVPPQQSAPQVSQPAQPPVVQPQKPTDAPPLV